MHISLELSLTLSELLVVSIDVRAQLLTSN